MLNKLGFRFAVIALSAAAIGIVSAQQPNYGVTQYANIPLSTFGSGAGNDCWGYVSPSGREYAIVGLNNKVAFVEVTNPSAPVIKATIPHTSSTWGDIKVYGQYAYAVTEASGTGIQVIDMGQIDSGVVTLKKTITNPGRTHNLALNASSGYLYTCGSNEGLGTTMCFSLLDPANPVRVGANSMTTNYQHDANVVTYTSGPMAGREIWFGCSEGRGVDIYDFTNKNSPTLIKRVVYPTMGYCHQAWLSADRKYLYVDDELDETNAGGTLNTRSLIFNVEDPANAFYVGTFTSGLPSIDHNQYVTDGFTFQANYQSGLRIFDLTGDPEHPTQVGAFDTFPSSDGASFNGAWSNYPFFPSGTVIVSDINSGLFVLNATEATTRSVPSTSMVAPSNATLTGPLSNLLESDNNYVEITSNQPGGSNPFEMILSAFAYDASPNKIRIVLESAITMASKVQITSCYQSVELYDWTTGSYVTVDIRRVGGTDTSIEVTAPGLLTRFVNSPDNKVQARVRWYDQEASRPNLSKVKVDQFKFRITR